MAAILSRARWVKTVLLIAALDADANKAHFIKDLSLTIQIG